MTDSNGSIGTYIEEVHSEVYDKGIYSSVLLILLSKVIKIINVTHSEIET
jgi:hypothetical protein